MKTKYIFLSLLISILTVNSFAQQLSMAEAVRLLEKNNGNLNAAKYAVEQRHFEQQKTKGLRLPNLGLEGNYTHINEDITIDLNPIRNAIAKLHQIPDAEGTLGSWNNVVQKQDFGNLNVLAKWPIYAGGKINIAIDASKLQEKSAENKQEITRDELYTSLIDLYYKTQLASKALALRTAIYESVNLHAVNANKLFKNGIVAEVETLNAKVALSNAQREVFAAKKDYSLAKTALENLIGEYEFDTLTTKFITPIVLQSLQEYQTAVLAQYPQLKYLNNQKELTKLATKKEKSAYLPEIALFGKKYVYRNNVSVLEPDWAVGVGLKFNVFDGFQRRNSIKAAQAQTKEVEYLDVQAKRSVNTFVEQLYNEIEKQREQYESLNNDEALAQKLKFMREKAFENGMGTSVEVIDATVQLSAIQLKKYQALYQYNAKYGALVIAQNNFTAFISEL